MSEEKEKSNMAVGIAAALIGPIAGLLNTGLGFIPNGEKRDRLNQKTNVQILNERTISELESEEAKAKQTTVIIYSVVALIVLGVVITILIKKRRNK